MMIMFTSMLIVLAIFIGFEIIEFIAVLLISAVRWATRFEKK